MVLCLHPIAFLVDYPLLRTIKIETMNSPLFRRIGIFFIPANFIGGIILLAGIGYAVYAFIDIDRRSHSVSDTLINFVFRLLIIGAVYSLIAFFFTRRKQ